MRSYSFREKKRTYFDSLLFYLRSRYIIKKIKIIPGPLSIIDIGCGYNPEFLQRISQVNSFKAMIGVDLSINHSFSDQNIKLMRSSLEEELPIESNFFDIAISTAVLEHLNNYELALREIYRIIKPGGLAFITTPAPLAKPILEFLAFRLKLIDEQEIIDHKRYFSRKFLKSVLLQIGYKKIITKKLAFGFNTLFICKK